MDRLIVNSIEEVYPVPAVAEDVLDPIFIFSVYFTVPGPNSADVSVIFELVHDSLVFFAEVLLKCDSFALQMSPLHHNCVF